MIVTFLDGLLCARYCTRMRATHTILFKPCHHPTSRNRYFSEKKKSDLTYPGLPDSGLCEQTLAEGVGTGSYSSAGTG